MKNLKYSELRHHMLAAISNLGANGIYLTCVNQKRSIWKARVHGLGQFNLSSPQARAVNDLLGAGLAHTPDWQGDMHAERAVRLTDSGVALLAEWDDEYSQEDT